MSVFRRIFNRRGFSLIEMLITAGILGFVAVGVTQIITDSNKIFTNSFTKLTTYFDEQIFFKELTKQIELSYVVKGGLFNCSGNKTLVSDIGEYGGTPSDDFDESAYEAPEKNSETVYDQTPGVQFIKLKNVGNSLAFPYVEERTIGTFDGSMVNDYLNAITALEQLSLQKKMWTDIADAVTPTQMADLDNLIAEQEANIENFSMDNDDFTLSILNPRRFQKDDVLLVSTITGSTISGLYKVKSVDKDNLKITLAATDIPSSFATASGCELDTDSVMDITSIITTAASMGAAASSTVILQKLRFIEYEVTAPEKSSSDHNDFLISFHNLAGKKEQARVKNFEEIRILTTWYRLSDDDALMLAGEYKAKISLSRYVLTHTGLINEKSDAVGVYSLKPSTRSNYDIATSPRSSSPIVPGAAVNVSVLIPGKVCDQLDCTGEPGLPEYADQFFQITAALKDSFSDVTFVATATGLECWGAMGGAATMRYDEDRDLFIFKRSAGTSGTVVLSKNPGAAAGRAFAATCHFKRDVSGVFEGGYNKDNLPQLEISMSYYDFNSGSVVNKLLGQETVPIYTEDNVLSNADPASYLCTNSGTITYPRPYHASVSVPIIRATRCKYGAGPAVPCVDGQAGLTEVVYHPRINIGSGPEVLSKTCIP